MSFFTLKRAQRLVLFERKKHRFVEKQVRIRVEKKKEPADSRSKGRILGEIKSRVKEESFESELFKQQEDSRKEESERLGGCPSRRKPLSPFLRGDAPGRRITK